MSVDLNAATGYPRSGAFGPSSSGRFAAAPVRLRRNGCQPKAVGLFFSVKNGRHLPYESQLELHDLWRAETDTEVVRSWAQPFTLSLVQGGKLTRYTPDRLDLMADGSQRVVEVKDQLAPGEERARFAPAAELLAHQGVSFELHQRVDIEAQPTLGGVQVVLRHRRTFISAANGDRLRRRLAAGPASFGEVASLLGGGLLGGAIVCAASVKRIVRVDLADGLHLEALVELVR